MLCFSLQLQPYGYCLTREAASRQEDRHEASKEGNRMAELSFHTLLRGRCNAPKLAITIAFLRFMQFNVLLVVL